MRKYFCKYKIILLLIVIFVFGLSGIWAEEGKQILINQKDNGNLEYIYRINRDIELRGVSSESKWYFNVEKELEVENFKFNLFLKFSELIRRDISYITVYMNNIPIRSIRLKDEEDQLIKNWQLDIPVETINTGYNELKVKTNSRLTDNSCDDDKNIANWVVIDKKSNYIIDYSRKNLYDKISDFPRPFIGKYEDESKGIGVIIPKNYTEDEISAALTLISHMKEYKKGYDVETTLFKYGDEEIFNFEGLIYVGNFNNIPQEIGNITKSSRKINRNEGNIYRTELSGSQKPVFLILSNDGKSLMNSVKALNNNELKSQMIDTYLSIPRDFNTDIKEEKIDDYIYLSELGLNGIEIKGRNKQVTSIGINIPSNKVLAEESNVNLKLRYSDNLDYDKSMVSLYINGKPLGSKKLERNKRDLDEFKVYIPKEFRRENYYDLRVEFEMIPDGIITCEKYLASEPWAYIKSDSFFFASQQERNLMLLENLPSPFSKNNNIDTTTIIIPDIPTKDDIKIAGRISEMMGIGLKGNKGIIRISRGDSGEENYKSDDLVIFDTPKEYSTDNLIVFGTPNENSEIRNINKSLWFKYNDNYNRVLSNEKIELLPQTYESSTFIELKPSPYNNEKALMTITSLDKKSIIDAVEYFYGREISLFTGDAAIVSKEGDLLNFRFQKESEKPVIDDIPTVNRNTREYLIFAGVVLVFMLISLILYLYKNRRNK
ncbi:cellulose biosynthesis cyclic di-GMP-binding regulatory protein BcsB [Maledivibacter halophilus]|uniref:Cellulose synthase subunit n=1 Tax=Maledivibacter halophilus TaxID=36842 RepID=A0A1T5MDC3_9FIRM|nr:cellulose biosynthesis cyclic di-GMP-binding regulatory protein BcsB [Maledivibacter halophilus]SKC86212.1 cellulose synthase subunit [Maledivibacter halophilus]